MNSCILTPEDLTDVLHLWLVSEDAAYEIGIQAGHSFGGGVTLGSPRWPVVPFGRSGWDSEDRAVADKRGAIHESPPERFASHLHQRCSQASSPADGPGDRLLSKL